MSGKPQPPTQPRRSPPGTTVAEGDAAVARSADATRTAAEGDWGLPAKSSGMRTEVKMALMLVVTLSGAFGYLVYRKFDDLKGGLVAAEETDPKTFNPLKGDNPDEAKLASPPQDLSTRKWATDDAFQQTASATAPPLLNVSDSGPTGSNATGDASSASGKPATSPPLATPQPALTPSTEQPMPKDPGASLNLFGDPSPSALPSRNTSSTAPPQQTAELEDLFQPAPNAQPAITPSANDEPSWEPGNVSNKPVPGPDARDFSPATDSPAVEMAEDLFRPAPVQTGLPPAQGEPSNDEPLFRPAGTDSPEPLFGSEPSPMRTSEPAFEPAFAPVQDEPGPNSANAPTSDPFPGAANSPAMTPPPLFGAPAETIPSNDAAPRSEPGDDPFGAATNSPVSPPVTAENEPLFSPAPSRNDAEAPMFSPAPIFPGSTPAPATEAPAFTPSDAPAFAPSLNASPFPGSTAEEPAFEPAPAAEPANIPPLMREINTTPLSPANSPAPLMFEPAEASPRFEPAPGPAQFEPQNEPVFLPARESAPALIPPAHNEEPAFRNEPAFINPAPSPPAFSTESRPQFEPTPQPVFQPEPAMTTPAAPMATYIPSGEQIPSDHLYTVRPGDNYWTISRDHYGTVRYFSALAEFNRDRIPDPSKMKPGMQMVIPDPGHLEAQFPKLVNSVQTPEVVASREREPVREEPGRFFVQSGQPMYRVGPGDTLTGIAQKHLGRASRWEQIYGMNRELLPEPDRLKTGTELRLPRDASQVAVTPPPTGGR